MSKNYIGYINANQTFTNDGIILNDANTVRPIETDDITQAHLSNIDTNFKYLYDLLTLDKRRINYLDIYRVDHSIGEQDQEKVGQYFGQLPAGHSLSIAVPFVEFNGVVYKKGDLLLKQENGEALRISAPVGGMFFPQINISDHAIKWMYTNQEQVNEKTYNYIGEYTTYPLTDTSLAQEDNYYCYNVFDPNTHKLVSSTYYLCTASASGLDPAVWVEILAGENFQSFPYIATIPTPAASEIARYNLQFSGSPLEDSISTGPIMIEDSDNQKIIPIVKYYHKDDNNYIEEVYCEGIIALNSSQNGWDISGYPSDYVNLIKVY